MRRILIMLLFLSLIATACSAGAEGGDESTTSSAAETETTGADEDTTTTAADESPTTTADTTTTTAATASAGGPSCVEGDWVFDSEAFVEAMRSFMTESELAGAEVEAVEGTYAISFAADGTYTGVRDDWGFSLGSADGTVVVRVNGEETGTWSADDSTITVALESSDAQVSASVESDGQTFELPSSPVEIPEAIAESSSYECDSDTLTVTTDEITFQLDRA